ncbi:MAG: 30S ribosomal protein S4 [Candidatus Omnitrophica bacterium]|nr:30S ribosomal protein S4 [Candidatus Omnitrophota bacterium]
MAKDLQAYCRKCRREGQKLFLKGARCFTHKCSVSRREYAPGQHGAKRSKLSNFGLQMREKQKLKRIYGMLEKQFRIYFSKAASAKGVTGHTLLQMLECRLDNVIFQMGFAASRGQGRQLVNHGYVWVNNRRVNIPSFQVKKDDEVQMRFQKKGEKLVKENIEASKSRNVPGWLSVDSAQYKAKILRLPVREDIQVAVNEQLIVELYSR